MELLDKSIIESVDLIVNFVDLKNCNEFLSSFEKLNNRFRTLVVHSIPQSKIQNYLPW